MSTARPRVVVTIPPARLGQVLTSEAIERLRTFAEVTFAEGDTERIGAQLGEILAEADVCLTSWGAPPITEADLDRAPRLRLIAHAAGSIKRLVPESAFARGITVCHAANVIADAVAEMTLLLMLLSLRDVHRLDRSMKAAQPWRELPSGYAPLLLQGRSIGLIGCGYVGRKVIKLLQPFRPVIRVYDPYLAPERASELGVTLASLDEVFSQSEIVSVHAPITPETRHMIGAQQLALLRDGAVIVNTARAWSVDQEALLRELQTGRIRAALDVFEPEPLPQDSPFRRLENVILTPHQAGYTIETYQRLGQEMVEEIERFWRGEPLRYRIAPEQHPVMA